MIKLKTVQENDPVITEIYNNNKLLGFVEKQKDNLLEDHPYTAYANKYNGKLFVGMFYQNDKCKKHAMDLAVDCILAHSA